MAETTGIAKREEPPYEGAKLRQHPTVGSLRWSYLGSEGQIVFSDVGPGEQVPDHLVPAAVGFAESVSAVMGTDALGSAIAGAMPETEAAAAVSCLVDVIVQLRQVNLELAAFVSRLVGEPPQPMNNAHDARAIAGDIAQPGIMPQISLALDEIGGEIQQLDEAVQRLKRVA